MWKSIQMRYSVYIDNMNVTCTCISICIHVYLITHPLLLLYLRTKSSGIICKSLFKSTRNWKHLYVITINFFLRRSAILIIPQYQILQKTNIVLWQKYAGLDKKSKKLAYLITFSWNWPLLVFFLFPFSIIFCFIVLQAAVPRDASPTMKYYEVLAIVYNIKDEKTAGNLVACINVGETYHQRKEKVTCTQWYLFNDFSILPIEKVSVPLLWQPVCWHRNHPLVAKTKLKNRFGKLFSCKS